MSGVTGIRERVSEADSGFPTLLYFIYWVDVSYGLNVGVPRKIHMLKF